MQRITNETRKRVVWEHIQDGRTLESLAAKYGVSKATVSNWVHAYRKECQTNDFEKSQLELMEEVRKLRQEKAELEKENLFLKKAAAFLRRKSISGISVHWKTSGSVRTPLVADPNGHLPQRILQLFQAGQSRLSTA